jgi:hypothetical protein
MATTASSSGHSRAQSTSVRGADVRRRGPDRQASPARRCPRHHVTLTASPPVGIGESDGAGRRPWNGHTPQLGRREVADRCARPVEGEQDGDAVHAMCQAVAPGAFEVVGGDEDASPQSHPAPGPGQVLDLGVPVSRRHGFGRGEHSEAAVGRCAQDGMHRQSVAASGVAWGDAREPVDGLRDSRRATARATMYAGSRGCGAAPGPHGEENLGTRGTRARRLPLGWAGKLSGPRARSWDPRPPDHSTTPQRTEERPSP